MFQSILYTTCKGVGRKFSKGGGGGGSQDIVKTDIGIAVLEMQLVEKIGNTPTPVLAPTTIITALYLHLITHVERKSKQFFLTWL